MFKCRNKKKCPKFIIKKSLWMCEIVCCHVICDMVSYHSICVGEMAAD